MVVISDGADVVVGVEVVLQPLILRLTDRTNVQQSAVAVEGDKVPACGIIAVVIGETLNGNPEPSPEKPNREGVETRRAAP